MIQLDPGTELIFAAGFALLVGGVLGLMHKHLSPDTQPSASDWRVGTLLTAGAAILQAFQQWMPPGLVLPLANLCAMLGFTLYWRAVRRLYKEPDVMWIFVLPFAVLAVLYWYTAVTPNFTVRVAAATAGLTIPCIGATWTLRRHRHDEVLTARRILMAPFIFSAAFIVFRGVYFVLNPDAVSSILDGRHWLSAATPMGLTVLPIVGTTAFLLLCVERIRHQWERSAATDELTGLPNRRTIIANGRARFGAAQRSTRGFAVAVIDLDHFKSINDRFGHAAGDAVLKHVAAVLEHACRGPHMVGRQGGEEFVALFEDVDASSARVAAERIRHAIEAAPVQLGTTAYTITASMGVGMMTASDQGFDDVLLRADQALYAAKNAGRNRVCFDLETP